VKSSFRTFAFALMLCACAPAGFAVAAADAPNVPSNDVLDALRVADAFGWAWAQRDAAAGAKTVAPAVRAKLGATAVATYFQGTSSPQHWAFAVDGGTRTGPARYRFGIRLYSYLFAGGGFTQPSTPKQLTITKGADGRWYAAGLP
jgi:hypothetical protein